MIIAEAQENEPHQYISVGLHAGLNIANVSASPPFNPSTDNRIGFVGGGTVEIPVGTNVYLMGGLFYVQAGYKFHNESWGVESDYLGIPIMAEYKFFGAQRKFAILLTGGGMPAFKVASAVPIVLPTLVLGGGTPSGEYNDNIANFDFSLLAGGGVEVYLDPTLTFRFDSRYAWSLTNAYVPQGLEIRGRNILITAGLNVNI